MARNSLTAGLQKPTMMAALVGPHRVDVWCIEQRPCQHCPPFCPRFMTSWQHSSMSSAQATVDETRILTAFRAKRPGGKRATSTFLCGEQSSPLVSLAGKYGRNERSLYPTLMRGFAMGSHGFVTGPPQSKSLATGVTCLAIEEDWGSFSVATIFPVV